MHFLAILLITIKITGLFHTEGVTVTVNTAVTMELVTNGINSDLLYECGLQIALEITFPYYCTYMYIVVKFIVQYINKLLLPSKKFYHQKFMRFQKFRTKIMML